jgi:nucleoid-associated protein YgaU
MGFAVGGVLLAVIIVAVLVVHRNKNHNKSVTIDLTGKSAPAEGAGSEVDVGAPVPSVTGGKQSDAAQPPVDQPKSAPDDHSRVKDRTGQDSGEAGDAGDKWNQLFVSTAADPIKELSSRARQKPAKQPQPADDSETMRGAVTDLRGAGDVNPLIQPPAERHDVMADPAPTTRPTSGRSTPRSHRVTQNETFASISRMVYGSERYIKAIQKANPTVNPARLKPGMVIQLPGETEAKQATAKAQDKPAAAASSGSALSADASTYTVQSGDNLYKISRKLYGNGSKGDELYTANKDRIGPDSTRLKIGMVLQLPEKPTIVSSR